MKVNFLLDLTNFIDIMKSLITLFFFLTVTFSFSQSLNEQMTKINDIKAKGNYKLALAETNKLIESGAEYAEVYLLKAQCLMEGRKQLTYDEPMYDVTIRALNKAIELDSNYSYPYGRRGLLNVLHRRFEQAVEDYSKFISLTTDSIELFNGYTDRGTAKMYLNDFQGAVEDYEIAILLNPNDISVYQNLGGIYTEMGDSKKSLEILFKGLEIYPNEAGLLNNIGFQYIINENFTEAISFFNRAIDEDKTDYTAMGNRAFCFIKLNELKKARKDLDNSLKLKPDNAYAYKYNAIYYIAKKDKENTCVNLEKANSLGYSNIYDNEVNDLILKHCK